MWRFRCRRCRSKRQADIHAVLPDGRDNTQALHDIGGMDLLLRPRLLGSELSQGLPSDAEDFDVGPNILKQLEALGAVEPGTVQAKAGFALWRALVIFHWGAVFAPGVTVVEHRYHLIAGDHFLDFSGNGFSAAERPAALAEYCIPPDEATHLDRVLAARSGSTASRDPANNFFAATLGYVLTTGANWAGPIRHFHLEITGEGEPFGRPKLDAIEFCADFPLRRPARGRIEADLENFTPTRDIHTLLLDTSGP